MKPNTTKCAWCGAVVPATRNSKRPQQHRNGLKTCVGSGQPIAVHTQIRNSKEQPK